MIVKKQFLQCIFSEKGRKAAMRRNRKNNAKKERIIMLASSAFVLTALTMTGIYMQTREEENRDDGYTLDFTALEDNSESKFEEIAENNAQEGLLDFPVGEGLALSEQEGLEDDLDYMPMEVDSGKVEIPGLTDTVSPEEKPEDGAEKDKDEDGQKNQESSQEAVVPDAQVTQEEPAEPEDQVMQEQPIQQADNADTRELHFAESEGLLRPLEGEILIPYSMDKGVFFETLEHYAYNSATMIVAQEGMNVAACADGKVVDISEDYKFGKMVTMDLGDGYQITYGQLKDINVSPGSYVNAGESVGTVAQPTRSFCREGANLYLKLTANGEEMDPEPLFR